MTNFLVDTVPTFDDIRVPLSSIKRLGFSDPDWVQFADDGAGSTGVYALAFSNTVDEEVYFSVQMPHGWQVGTDLGPHVHWSPSNGASGSVTWKLEYTIAEEITGTFGNTATVSVTDASDEVAKKHQLGFLTNIDMSSYTDPLNISIMLVCRLYRDVSDGDDYGADAFLLEIDFHYQSDADGSRAAISR